jgi:hypothetical protein
MQVVELEQQSLAPQQEWLNRRLSGTSPQHFHQQGVGILTTWPLDAPPGFEDGFMVIDHRFDAQRAFQILNPFPFFVIFCNVLDAPHKTDCARFIADLARLGLDDKSVVLVPHSVAPEFRGKPSESDRALFLKNAMLCNADEVISEELSGVPLVLSVRGRILSQDRLLRNLEEMLDTSQDLVDHADWLQECYHGAMWSYAVHRLHIQLPAEDMEMNEPTRFSCSLGHFQVGTAIRKSVNGTAIHKLADAAGASTDLSLKTVPKSMTKSIQDLMQLDRYLRVMNSLSTEWKHPHVVKLHHVINSANHVAFVVDAGQETLYRRLKDREQTGADCRPLPTERCWSIITQLIDAVTHMHLGPKRTIICLKPESIAFSESDDGVTVKILGASMPADSSYHQGWNFPFVAPEVLLEKIRPTYHSDIWCCGLLFLEVACRVNFIERVVLGHVKNSRWAGLPCEETMRKVRDVFSTPGSASQFLKAEMQPYSEDLSTFLSPMLDGMMTVDPVDRWTSSDNLEAGRGSGAEVSENDLNQD